MNIDTISSESLETDIYNSADSADSNTDTNTGTNGYKQKYFKYKAKYFKKLNEFNDSIITNKEGSFNKNKMKILNNNALNGMIMTQPLQDAGSIDIDKRIKKLVPKINSNFIDFYLTVKLGLANVDKNKELDGKQIATVILGLMKKQLSGDLKPNNDIIQKIVRGINNSKISGLSETSENVVKEAQIFNKLYDKRKDKKGSDYSIKQFEKYIIGLLIKIFDAEYEVVSGINK
jgi:hypothetical protein